MCWHKRSRSRTGGRSGGMHCLVSAAASAPRRLLSLLSAASLSFHPWERQREKQRGGAACVSARNSRITERRGFSNEVATEWALTVSRRDENTLRLFCTSASQVPTLVAWKGVACIWLQAAVLDADWVGKAFSAALYFICAGLYAFCIPL